MKGWVGTGIALVAVLIALLLDPKLLFGQEAIVAGRFLIMAVLLGAVGIAFLLGQATSELSFSRHTATWSAALAIVTVGAINIDLLTGRQAEAALQAKAAKIYVPKKIKKRKAAEVLHPDTLKINRVERIVDRASIDPFGNYQPEEVLVTNRLSKRNSKLDANWQPSREEKERFKKFLKKQGLKYDPKTAFQLPSPQETLSQN